LIENILFFTRKVEDILSTFKKKKNQGGKKPFEVFTPKKSAKWTKDVLTTLYITFVAASI